MSFFSLFPFFALSPLLSPFRSFSVAISLESLAAFRPYKRIDVNLVPYLSYFQRLSNNCHTRGDRVLRLK